MGTPQIPWEHPKYHGSTLDTMGAPRTLCTSGPSPPPVPLPPPSLPPPPFPRVPYLGGQRAWRTPRTAYVTPPGPRTLDPCPGTWPPACPSWRCGPGSCCQTGGSRVAVRRGVRVRGGGRSRVGPGGGRPACGPCHQSQRRPCARRWTAGETGPTRPGYLRGRAWGV